VRVVAGRWVFTGSAVVPDGAIALDGDVIAAAGPRAPLEARFGPAERLDAVLLPALVNAHTHLELSHLGGRIPGGEGLAAWVHLLVATRAEDPGPGRPLEDAVLDLVEAGVAAVGDVSNTLASLDPLGRAGLAGTVFHEVFGFSERRIEAALAQADALRAAAPAPGPGLRIAPSPHAVYSTHPRVVAELLRAGPASIHLAEDPAERSFCATGAGPFATMNRAFGAPPLPRLGRSAVAVAAPHLGPWSLAVHAVDLDDEDLVLLARSGATAVLCPRSNLHIGGRLADLPRLLAAGVPLAVGTDSLASAPSLAPLAELAALARGFPQVPAARLLALAWNGAAVGAPAVGRLAPGAAPGILAAPLDGARPADPARWLVETFGAEERPFQWIARHRPFSPVLSPAGVEAARTT
jgi:cytosine/adenosine deaminase-related metal-dependent hydrolase